MKGLVTVFLLTTALVAVAQPQDTLVGTYAGNFTAPPAFVVTFELIITTVEKDVVRGAAKIFKGVCSPGEYSMEGKLTGHKLIMKSTSPGRTADCGFGFEVVREGNKFVGATGNGLPLEFSK